MCHTPHNLSSTTDMTPLHPRDRKGRLSQVLLVLSEVSRGEVVLFPSVQRHREGTGSLSPYDLFPFLFFDVLEQKRLGALPFYVSLFNAVVRYKIFRHCTKWISLNVSSLVAMSEINLNNSIVDSQWYCVTSPFVDSLGGPLMLINYVFTQL